MGETRPRGRPAPAARAVGAARPNEQPLDDWLGDISDEDWGENPAERAERRAATAHRDLRPPEGDLRREPTGRPEAARPVDTAEARRAVIERRRLVAGLVLLVILGLAVAISVLLLRDGGQPSATPVTEPATTTSVPTESSPSTPTTAPPTSPSTSTTPTTTTPSTPGASTFTLPEGTKLRLGEGDPALVSELQQALSDAGYEPGPVDGTFGQGTKAAVIAFQQANGLSADGVVGPETASALNSALAGG